MLLLFLWDTVISASSAADRAREACARRSYMSWVVTPLPERARIVARTPSSPVQDCAAPRLLLDVTTQQLDAQLQRRRQLLERLVAECHRVVPAPPMVWDNLARYIDDLQGVINAMDEDVATSTAKSKICRGRIRHICYGSHVREGK